jgi:hypothetical protein
MIRSTIQESSTVRRAIGERALSLARFGGATWNRAPTRVNVILLQGTNRAISIPLELLTDGTWRCKSDEREAPLTVVEVEETTIEYNKRSPTLQPHEERPLKRLIELMRDIERRGRPDGQRARLLSEIESAASHLGIGKNGYEEPNNNVPFDECVGWMRGAFVVATGQASHLIVSFGAAGPSVQVLYDAIVR